MGYWHLTPPCLRPQGAPQCYLTLALLTHRSCVESPVPSRRSFAKGPLYFLAAPLAARVTADAWVQAELRALSHEGGAHSTLQVEKTWAWEDVFLGLALSHVNNRSVLNLFAVDAGLANSFSSLYQPGLKLAPTTALWHAMTLGSQRKKSVSRIGHVHAWQRANHCALAVHSLICFNFTGCAGGQWRSCYTIFRPAARGTKCSTRLIDVAALMRNSTAA